MAGAPQTVSVFGRKGLVLIRPPKLVGRLDTLHAEYGVPMVFRSRLEGQRAYDKQSEITAVFSAKQLADLLVHGLHPKAVALDVASQSPGHPAKIKVDRTEDDHIAFSVSVRKDGKQLETCVETSLADFKFMQILFEHAIPKMVGWDATATPSKPPSEDVPKTKPTTHKSLAESFVSSCFLLG